MCSVLIGDYAPIDSSDGCGMNLLNLRTKQWEEKLLNATAPLLGKKLGAPAASHNVVGTVAGYFNSQYGLPTTTKVIAWSGDNPCSVAGLGLAAPGDVAVSLGTSDTIFGILSTPAPGVEGHLFANPVDPASYMAMLCYKNGSLTRERIKAQVTPTSTSWDNFNALLKSTPPGNQGSIGFYVDSPEITPAIPRAGVYRFGRDGKRVESFEPATEARAVIEGQFISMRIHGESVGLTGAKRLIATGGASANKAVLQVLADVFGAPVYVSTQTDSASLGAAVRALQGAAISNNNGKFIPVGQLRGDKSSDLTLAVSPVATATAAYTALIPAYKKAEKEVCSL